MSGQKRDHERDGEGTEMDDLTASLLKKCEVSSLPQFYKKIITEKEHTISLSALREMFPNLTEEKILEDLEGIDDLVVINIVDVMRVGGRPQQKEVKKEKYAVDYIGLGMLLTFLKKKRLIAKSAPLARVYQKLEISPQKKGSATAMLERAIDETYLYANLVSYKGGSAGGSDRNGTYLVFYNKLMHPDNRGEVAKLLLILLALVILLVVFVPFLISINTFQ